MKKLRESICEIPSNHLGAVVQSVVREGLHSMTMALGPRMVIRATQALVHGKLSQDRSRLDIDVTIGAPNYKARAWIKGQVKAGECFPMFRADGVPKARAPKGKGRKSQKVRQVRRPAVSKIL